MTTEYLMPTYNRFSIELVDGHDFHLQDNTGKVYVDFTSGIGVCNLGYHNPATQAAVTEQLQHVWHVSNLYPHHLQTEVAALLAPKNYKTFFCNSGTEANEAAFKLARKYTNRKEILAFNYGFHGRTMGSLSITGYPAIQDGFKPLVAGAHFSGYNDNKALDTINNQTAAVILEVIQGEGGVNVGEKIWLQAIEKRCHDTGALLIIDEVQTGMGRTGYKFAHEIANLHPDIITVAKGLANGLPVGAMMAKAQLANTFGPGSHGNTFGGNPIVMASAKAVLQQLTPSFLQTVQAKGKVLHTYLTQTILPLSAVTSISGVGLMIGIHLEASVEVIEVVKKLQGRGLLTLSARGNTLRLLPPLIINDEAIKWSVQQIKIVLEMEK